MRDGTPRPSLTDCDFYHWTELRDGTVLKGAWDLRQNWPTYLGGVDLRGQRVLEMGPASGFLSLMMERDGADVVAFDLPYGAGPDILPVPTAERTRPSLIKHLDRIKNGWWFLHDHFGSRNTASYGDIYNLPDMGTFDVSLFGAILLHLRDPFRAIEQAARVTTRAIIITDLAPKPGTPDHCMEFDPNDGKAGEMGWWLMGPGSCMRMLRLLGFPIFHRCEHEHMHIPHDGSAPRTMRYFTLVGMRREGDLPFKPQHAAQMLAGRC
jgi:SAM-dependent methyltransferase